MTDAAPASEEAPRRRRRGAERGPAAAISRGQPSLPFKPVDLLSADELEAIHHASLQVLKEIGMDFLHPEAKTVLKAAGADVDSHSDRVRFDPALIEAQIGKAPRQFT